MSGEATTLPSAAWHPLDSGGAASLGWKRAVSAVDEPNKASVRVLEKTGFRLLFSFPEAFGQQHYFGRSFEEDGG